ncbi:Histidine kinase [Gammaproteobacteria bacterium]
MKILLRTTIAVRLRIVFLLILLLTVAMGGFAIHTMMNLSGLSGKLYNHPFTVTSAILELRADVLDIEQLVANLIHTTKTGDIDSYTGEIAAVEADAQNRLAIVRDRFLGRQEDIIELARALAQWKAARDTTIALIRAGRTTEAIARNDSTDTTLADATRRALDSIRAFAANKAIAFRQMADQEGENAIHYSLIALLILVILSMLITQIITRSIVRPLSELRDCMTQLSSGDLTAEIPNREGNNEISAMAKALEVFKESAVHLDSQRWVKEGVTSTSLALQKAEELASFARHTVSNLVPLLEAGIGVLHIWSEERGRFELMGSYGHTERRSAQTSFKIGEGLAGQCALEQTAIILDEVPADFMRITSGIGEAVPRVLLATPIISRGKVIAVLEIGAFKPFRAAQQALLDEVIPAIAANLEILARNLRTQTLLEKTQQQTEELQVSEEELRIQSDALQAANEELRQKSHALEVQTEELRASEEELHVQHDTIQAANEELRQKGQALEERSLALEAAKREADRRALELDAASRYKSEFLANMSHELRTPLNSLLILAKVLADNEEGNLTEDQVESATVVYDSGNHLLRLINDILDLTKVEAGKMQLVASDVSLASLTGELLRRFNPLAANRELTLRIETDEGMPSHIKTDRNKLEQILNNLIGNAIKFTSRGEVTVHIFRPLSSQHLTTLGLDLEKGFAIAVTDTGIGIAPENTDRIFRAFEQVDGSTSREYGGTGLGLTISQKLAHLMGGDITVDSVQGRGSTFTLYLPLSQTTMSYWIPPATTPNRPTVVVESHPACVPTTTAVAPLIAGPTSIIPVVRRSENTILVIEDDPAFARVVGDLAKKRGFRTLVASNGRMGLELAQQYRPTGIILDISLPEIDGWTVMERLKATPETRQIPVHVMSADDDKLRGLKMGAIGFDTKPTTKEQINKAFERLIQSAATIERRILLVDDDPATRLAVSGILKNLNAEIVYASDGQSALESLQTQKFDCVILDLTLPGLSGFEILNQMSRSNERLPPVVICTGRDLSVEETLKLREYTDSIVIKGAHSPERLLDEVTLFLHSVHANTSGGLRPIPPPVTEITDEKIAGRTVLVVDDDMRNAFALSKVLRAKGLNVLMAQDGYKALAHLEEGKKVDIVLMDIMMPGMDGYQTIRKILNNPHHARLPIIALTAKAMSGDREKCLECGASDYLSKPIDIDRLLERMRTLMQETR